MIGRRYFEILTDLFRRYLFYFSQNKDAFHSIRQVRQTSLQDLPELLALGCRGRIHAPTHGHAPIVPMTPILSLDREHRLFHAFFHGQTYRLGLDGRVVEVRSGGPDALPMSKPLTEGEREKLYVQVRELIQEMKFDMNFYCIKCCRYILA